MKAEQSVGGPMKLAITLQFAVLLILGLPIIALIVFIVTVNRMIDRVPDITIVWRDE